MEKDQLLNSDSDLPEGDTGCESNEIAITQNDVINIKKQHSSCETIKSTPKRWYILTLFSLIGFMQNLIWNTWGPIAQSSKLVFNWDDATIALTVNWGPIAFIISAFFYAWLMEVKGMRHACLLSAALVAAGAGIRCAAVYQPIATWVIHIGQLLNGLSSPTILAGIPVISAIWFPTHQRTTATAIASSVGLLGASTTYILGPYVVTENTNSTECKNSSSSLYNISNCTEKIDEAHAQIMILLYAEAAVSAVLFLLMLVHFPPKPVYAPSASAGMKRTDFKKGASDLLKNLSFWLLAIPLSLSEGVFQCWGAMLNVNLSPHGISEDTAGWIGLWCTLSGQIVALGLGIFADLFARRMKMIFLILYSIATVVFIGFTLQVADIFPLHIYGLYITSIVGSMCLFGALPLLYELGCETAYPVAEGITNTVITVLINTAGFVFLLLFYIPNIGTVWMNWLNVASVAVCIPVVIIYKEHYARNDIDIVIQTKVEKSS